MSKCCCSRQPTFFPTSSKLFQVSPDAWSRLQVLRHWRRGRLHQQLDWVMFQSPVFALEISLIHFLLW
ncbi:hypothetical protein Ancab_032130 [Ancistrocladus abbreviatus]